MRSTTQMHHWVVALFTAAAFTVPAIADTCQVAAAELFPGRQWGSSSITLRTTQRRDVRDAVTGVTTAHTSMEATAVFSGVDSVGGCVGVSLIDGDTVVPVVWDVDAPIFMYDIEVAGWIPEATRQLRVPKCRLSPVAHANQMARQLANVTRGASLLEEMAWLSNLTAAYASGVGNRGSWSTRRLLAQAARVLLMKLDHAEGSPAKDGPWFGHARARARGVLPVGEDIVVPVNSVGTRAVGDAIHGRQVFLLELTDATAVGMSFAAITIASLAMGVSQRNDRSINELDGRATNLTRDQQTVVSNFQAIGSDFGNIANGSIRNNASLWAINATVARTTSSLIELNAWQQTFTQNEITFSTQLAGVATGAAEYTNSTAARFEALTRNTVELGDLFKNATRDNFDAQNMKQRAFVNATNEIFGRLNAEAVATYHRIVREIVALDSRVVSNDVLLDEVIRFANVMIKNRWLFLKLAENFHWALWVYSLLGFTPFVLDTFGASTPAPARVWAPDSPLRDLVVDIQLYVRVGSTGTVVQDRVEVHCDPLANADTMEGVVRPEALFSYLSADPWCAIPSDADVDRVADARPCVCWLKVQRSTCPANIAPRDVVVAMPSGATAETDHPRVVTMHGIAGVARGSGAELALNTSRPVFPAVNYTGSGRVPGYARYTPCDSAPVVLPPVLARTRADATAWVSEWTCPPLSSIRETNATWPAVAGMVVADVYVASLTDGVRRGLGGFLDWRPHWVGNRTLEGVLATLGTPVYPAGTLPRCTLSERKAVAISRLAPSPLSELLQLWAGAWSDASVAIRAAQLSAYGSLSRDVFVEQDDTQVIDGTEQTCAFAEVTLTQGGWAPVYMATRREVRTSAKVAVPARRSTDAAGVTRNLPEFRATAGAVLVDESNIGAGIPWRFPFACPVECLFRPCALPDAGKFYVAAVDPGPATRYVCDVPFEWLPTAQNEALRRNSLTYIWNNDTRPWGQWGYNFTQTRWSAQNGGKDFDTTHVAGSVADYVVTLVPVEVAAPGWTPVGLSDVVCKGDTPQQTPPELLARNLTVLTNGTTGTQTVYTVSGGSRSAGPWCTWLRYMVLFTPDLLGRHSRFVGTPVERCGAADDPLLCWVARRVVVVAADVSVPAGVVASEVFSACPVPNTVLAEVTGLPRVEFGNKGAVATGAWWYQFAPGGLDDDRDDGAASAETRERVCIASDLVAGPALDPGESVAVFWASICARWVIRVFVDDPIGGVIPCGTHPFAMRIASARTPFVDPVAVAAVTEMPVYDDSDLVLLETTQAAARNHVDAVLSQFVEAEGTVDAWLKGRGVLEVFEGAMAMVGNPNVTATTEARNRILEELFAGVSQFGNDSSVLMNVINKTGLVFDHMLASTFWTRDRVNRTVGDVSANLTNINSTINRVADLYNATIRAYGPAAFTVLGGARGLVNSTFVVVANGSTLLSNVTRGAVDIQNAWATLNDSLAEYDRVVDADRLSLWSWEEFKLASLLAAFFALLSVCALEVKSRQIR